MEKGGLQQQFPDNNLQLMVHSGAKGSDVSCDKSWNFLYFLNPVAGRPGLPGIKCIHVDAAATTVAANGGLWTLGFNSIFLSAFLYGTVMEYVKLYILHNPLRKIKVAISNHQTDCIWFGDLQVVRCMSWLWSLYWGQLSHKPNQTL